MIDHNVLSESEQDQLALLAWVYLEELACPHSVLFKLRPTVALGKVCRDCSLNPARAACIRRQSVRRASRAPRRQRGCRRGSGGQRDDGDGDGGADSPPQLSLDRIGGASS